MQTQLHFSNPPLPIYRKTRMSAETTVKARDLFQSGDLNGAIEAAVQEVKNAPADIAARRFLIELLCFAGDLERADKHLDTVSTLQPETAIPAMQFRQIIRAAQARFDFFDAGAAPHFITPAGPAAEMLIKASIAYREGAAAEAFQLCTDADETRPPVSGAVGDQPFNQFRDLDDQTSAIFEVFCGDGKYYWLPLEAIRSIEFSAPKTPRDLLWREVNVELHDGPDVQGCTPAIYPASREADDQSRLGRSTSWLGEEGEVVRGVGQKLYLVGEEDTPIMQLQKITFTKQ